MKATITNSITESTARLIIDLDFNAVRDFFGYSAEKKTHDYDYEAEKSCDIKCADGNVVADDVPESASNNDELVSSLHKIDQFASLNAQREALTLEATRIENEAKALAEAQAKFAAMKKRSAAATRSHAARKKATTTRRKR
jgi:hypothetical protein